MACVWLAASLLPTLAHAWQDPATAAALEICTTSSFGSATRAASLAQGSSEDVPLQAHAAEHCPLCTLHGALPLPPVLATFEAAPALRFETPVLPAPAPASRLAWTQPLSRAPPPQS
jgi:hypothetical protein